MISVSIMAHPSREKNIPYLLEKLGDVPVSWDRGEGIWENRKRASLMFNPEASHHLVIQDDAVIGKNFYEEVNKQIKERPDHAFSFYYGNRKGMRELANNELKNKGVQSKWFFWGVAICLPTKIIPDLMTWCSNMPNLKNHDDTRISHYIRKNDISVWYPLPSLVDHRDDYSLMENSEGNSNRRAFLFIGE